jgi:hypothetical protein
MSTAQKLAEKLLEIQALANDLSNLCGTFLREENPGDQAHWPLQCEGEEEMLRDILYLENDDYMTFLRGVDPEGYGSPADVARDVLKYANQKMAA